MRCASLPAPRLVGSPGSQNIKGVPFRVSRPSPAVVDGLLRVFCLEGAAVGRVGDVTQIIARPDARHLVGPFGRSSGTLEPRPRPAGWRDGASRIPKIPKPGKKQRERRSVVGGQLGKWREVLTKNSQSSLPDLPLPDSSDELLMMRSLPLNDALQFGHSLTVAAYCSHR